MKNHAVLALLILLTTPAMARAACSLAPEIDLSAAPAALCLLGGAALVLRSRRQK
jgi:hypothetical protein